MLDVTLADVAAYASNAPPVTQAQLEEALDWVEVELERSGTVLVSGSREERAAKRAVCAKALSISAGKRAQGDAEDVGTTIKIEGRGSTTVTAENTAAILESAAALQAEAWSHLYAAGLPRPKAFAGVSR